MFKSLMTSRKFAPLFWCQLCSALNDNFLKNALAMLILFGLGGAGGAAGEHGGMLITVSGIVFIAPFFILSALGGELADRYDKAFVAQRIRLVRDPHRRRWPRRASSCTRCRSCSLRSACSAWWPPCSARSSTASCPRSCRRPSCPPATRWLKAQRSWRSSIGTIAGGIAVAAAGSARDRRRRHPGAGNRLLVVRPQLIPAAGPAAPGLTITANPWVSTLALLRELKTDRRLWGGAHIISWFWLVGFVVLSLLPALIKTLVGGSEGVVTMCLAVFTVGIAIGSGLAARASHGQPNLGLVPLGALLMGIFALGIAWIASMLAPGAQPIGPAEVLASGTGLALLVCLCGLAVAGGLFIVPSFAAVQSWAPVDRRARVIAAVNVLNAAYMVGAGGIVAVLQAVGVGVPLLFAALGVLSIAAVAYVVHAWGSEVHARRRPHGVQVFF